MTRVLPFTAGVSQSPALPQRPETRQGAILPALRRTFKFLRECGWALVMVIACVSLAIIVYFRFAEWEEVVGYKCAWCNDIHGPSYVCDRELSAFCADCFVDVVITPHSECSECGGRSLSGITLHNPPRFWRGANA